MNSSTSSSNRRPFKRYLAAYFALMGIAAAALVPNYFFLKNSGELLSLPKIVEIQCASSTNILFGTALHDITFFYKQYLFDKLNPEVVGLGSSRMMLLRKEFFKRPFVNMGGTMGSFIQGLVIADKITGTDKNLKTVLIGVDFWWFNGKLEHSFETTEPQHLTFKKLLTPFTWLYKGKITAGEYLRRASPFYDSCNDKYIGVLANRMGSGFGPDGSYFYSNVFIGEKYSPKQISIYVDMARKGTARFLSADRIVQSRLDSLIKLLKVFKSKNINVVVFLTPVAPSVAKAMKESGNFKYVDDMKESFAKNNIRYYDFLDVSMLGATDSEFYDGIHGSELTYCRILDSLYRNEEKLDEVIDINQVRKYLDNPDIVNLQPHKHKMNTSQKDQKDSPP